MKVLRYLEDSDIGTLIIKFYSPCNDVNIEYE